MCGRLNITDDPAVMDLCEQLGIQFSTSIPLRQNRFTRAATPISIIHQQQGKNKLSDAIWWLLLEPSETGFKPSKYTSFNTRWDKLNTPRSAGYQAFRTSRCIIPAKGFGETQGKGKEAKYTDFIADGAVAFGGLYRHWVNNRTGEHQLSCSVITLPPHPKLQQYHQKSSPLMLNQKDDSMRIWLDPSSSVQGLNQLLYPCLPQSLSAFAIDRPSSCSVIGEAVKIASD